jgi:peroxiredoxin
MKNKKKSIRGLAVFLTAVMLLTFVLLPACSKKKNSGGDDGGNAEQSKVGIEIGNIAPDFSIPLLSGETVKLSDYRGKVVLLNFWATWCGPCVDEMPAIQQISDDFANKAVVLAVNVGEKKDKIEKFIKDKKFTFNIGLDENNEVSMKYPTEGIPLSIVLKADGSISYTNIGAGNNMYPIYKKQIEIALGELKSDELSASQNEEEKVYEAYLTAYDTLLFWAYDYTDTRPMEIGKESKKIDGKKYYKVNKSEKTGSVKTLSDLKKHLLTMFSETFVSELFAKDLYRDINGALYVQPAARLKITQGRDVNTEIIKKSDFQYILRVSVSNKDGKSVSKDMIYEKIGDQWIFTKFELMMGAQ